MSESIFIKDENDYNEFKKLKPTHTYNLTKVKFRCRKCNLIKEKLFKYLTTDFLCKTCNQKQKANNPETIRKRKNTCIKKYGVDNYNKTIEGKEKHKQTCLEKYGVENYTQTDEYKNKTIQTYLKKYGTEYFSQTPEFKEKVKETCLEKYGVENYSQCSKWKEQVKETCLEKYGVESYSQTDEFKNKTKQTCLEKYGVENYSQTNEYKEKLKNNYLELYGIEYYTQTDEFKNKSKQTCLEKYGVENYSQTNEFKNKSKQTCLERYGTEYYTQTNEYKDRVKQTYLEKYGLESYSQTDEFKNKLKQTCLKKYGVENPSQVNEVKERIKQSFLERYGYNSYTKTDEYKIKYHETCLNNLKERFNKLNLILLNKDDNNIIFKCNNCNKTFSFSRSYTFNLLNHYQNNFCPYCSRIIYSGKSLKEKDLLNYIKTLYNGIILENDRVILNGKEIDIYLPDLKLGFEFDGTYWHADPRFFNETDIIEKTNKIAKDIWEYDINKILLCEQLGITLIRIKEYDWDTDIINIKNNIKLLIENSNKNI